MSVSVHASETLLWKRECILTSALIRTSECCDQNREAYQVSNALYPVEKRVQGWEYSPPDSLYQIISKPKRSFSFLFFFPPHSHLWNIARLTPRPCGSLVRADWMPNVSRCLDDCNSLHTGISSKSLNFTPSSACHIFPKSSGSFLFLVWSPSSLPAHLLYRTEKLQHSVFELRPFARRFWNLIGWTSYELHMKLGTASYDWTSSF